MYLLLTLRHSPAWWTKEIMLHYYVYFRRGLSPAVGNRVDLLSINFQNKQLKTEIHDIIWKEFKQRTHPITWWVYYMTCDTHKYIVKHSALPFNPPPYNNVVALPSGLSHCHTKLLCCCRRRFKPLARRLSGRHTYIRCF